MKKTQKCFAAHFINTISDSTLQIFFERLNKLLKVNLQKQHLVYTLQCFFLSLSISVDRKRPVFHAEE